MGKPLNWVLSDVLAKKTASRALRNRLAATTILAVAPFLGYGRQAYAACDTSGAPLVLCSGTITGGSADGAFTYDNADVRTTGAFTVTTDGLYIDGDGHIQFTDNNQSTITNVDGPGLTVRSNDDTEDTPGAVTIITNGTITGTEDGIRAQNYGSGDLSITANGNVTGLESFEDSYASDGIYAINYGNDLTITTGAQSVIKGDDNAIDARNYGEGALDIKVNGEAKSYDYDGVYARNYGKDLKITIGAEAMVDGAGNGVHARNYSEDSLDITVDGQVIARRYNEETEDYQGLDGIRAYNFGNDLTVTTGAQSVILGNSNGIDARNYGAGDLKVAADGVVTGYYNDAIHARNYGRNLIITTGAQSVVRGGGNGIGAYNFGDGRLEITADGLVGGYSEDTDGIHAVNSSQGHYNPDTETFYYGDLTITTGAESNVFGEDDGIDARNFGYGDLEITANGEVTGKDGDGIHAINFYGEYYNHQTERFYDGRGQNLTITTGAQSVVTGASHGIYARNSGLGNLTITVDGEVTGNGADGIYAYNTGFGGNNFSAVNNFAAEDGNHLRIETGAQSVVTGSADGIDAVNRGYGELRITANGEVTGHDGDGIRAYNAYGSYYDPESEDFRALTIAVGASGLVQGSHAGIAAYAGFGEQDISITNDGTVRNLSGESDDLAIITGGGATAIDNNGSLIGIVELGDFEDVLDNDGVWNTAGGENDFGGSDDVLNNTGTLVAADGDGDNEVTQLNNLETFNNSGLVTLVDGKEGDELQLNDGDYEGEGGTLAVDARLGPGADGVSDTLTIEGDTSGTTLVSVNVVGVTGVNFDGIQVVIVDGDTVESDFNLAGPLYAGFYRWDLRLDDGGGSWHELFTAGVGVGAFEFAAGITGAQDISNQILSTLMQRQADLRPLLGGTQVTPVADFADPVEPTPVARVTPGFWLKGVGAWLERDDEENGFTLDRKQTIFGGLAGFDFGTENAGEVWMFGLFGGYLTSDLEFDETNSEWTYEGPSVGAYATYMDDAFYADALVKADFLDIDIDADDLAPGAGEAETDAFTIGGLINTGYKFGHEFFIEPQASLAVVNTQIDDVDIFGGTVEFDDATSIRGRLGLRLGHDYTASDATVYSGDVTASVWEDFSGDNNVSITDPAFGSFDSSDDASGTYGDVSLGFSMAAPEGWSSFIRGNYVFGEDFESISGNAGLRYAF